MTTKAVAQPREVHRPSLRDLGARVSVALAQRVFTAPGALAALVVACVGVNTWWIYSHLAGMPFDIDAAGYLQRAVRDGDALRSGGIGAYVDAVRTPGDFQAPLLTALGGLLEGIAGVGTLKLTALVQLFYVILVVSTYSVARRVLGRRWSVLAALIVACVPAVLQMSRDFDFSVPAAALVTASLALQLHAGDFRSLVRSLLWGAMLGLASLTRTMTIALLPVLVIVAIPRLAQGVRRPRRVLNVAAGLLVGALVAGTWYSATWRAVLNYLTTYGYGSKAASYGAASSWLNWAHWSARLDVILNEDVLLPLSLALVAGAIAGGAYAAVRCVGRRRTRSRSRSLDWRAAPRWATMLVSSDLGTLWAFVIVCYVVLSSTQNGGSYFELPLLPALAILLLWLADHVSGPPRGVIAGACLVGAGLSFVNQSGWLLGNYAQVESVKLGSTQMIAFDSRGFLIRYASEVLGGCPGIYSCISPELSARELSRGASNSNAVVNAYLRAWNTPVDAATRFIESYARDHGRYPVLFFAVQDPFFNTNTVALQAQLDYGAGLPIGLLQPPGVAGAGYLNQLNLPQFGEPNFVLEGPLPANPYSAAFSPDNHEAVIVALLRKDGFNQVDSVSLPDHRVLGIWWKLRGATLTG